MALLSLDSIYLQFGGVAALAGVSLEVDAGDFFAIIGPNGAGKTSIFNCISGIYAPTARADPLRRAGHHRASSRTGAPSSGSRAPSRTSRCSRA